MILKNKVYKVIFAFAEDDEEIEGERAFTVQAETGERAIEIARQLLPKKGRSAYFVEAVDCLVFALDNG